MGCLGDVYAQMKRGDIHGAAFSYYMMQGDMTYEEALDYIKDIAKRSSNERGKYKIRNSTSDTNDRVRRSSS